MATQSYFDESYVHRLGIIGQLDNYVVNLQFPLGRLISRARRFGEFHAIPRSD